MSAIKVQNPKAEVYDADKFLDDVSHGRMDLKGSVNKFIDYNGGHKEFVGFVGSATNSLARKFKAISIMDTSPLVQSIRTRETEAIIELTRTLSERNEMLRKEIKKEAGEVEKDPGKDVERKPSEKELIKFVEDNFLRGPKRRFNPIKAKDALLKIRESPFSPEDTARIMDRLIEGYYWERSRNGVVQLEESIRTVNTVLAEEYQDLTYSLNCAKNRAEFKDLKAA